MQWFKKKSSTKQLLIQNQSNKQTKNVSMKYTNYKSHDFLMDDFFIKSMLFPNEKSEKMWKKMIDNEDINVDEFLSAYMTLKELNSVKIEFDAVGIENTWKRIQSTNSILMKRKKRFRIAKYIGYAAALVIGVISISNFYNSKFSDLKNLESITDFASENFLTPKLKSNQIQLINSQKIVELNGSEADVHYDKRGNVQVNNKSIFKSINKSPQTSLFSQIYVPFGKRANLLLSDGTKLIINTGTRVIFPTTFTADKREIFVDGEVFAEVAHDLKKPFIIKTTKLDVRVFGTVFNLTAYKEDKQVNLVLVSGSVGVTPKNGKTTFVKPNELLSYNDQAITLQNVDVENYISWKDGIYAFENEPLENILLRLSRYYNVTIKLPGTASGITCSGKLELKDDINIILNGLRQITPINYGVKDNVYKVSFQ